MNVLELLALAAIILALLALGLLAIGRSVEPLPPPVEDDPPVAPSLPPPVAEAAPPPQPCVECEQQRARFAQVEMAQAFQVALGKRLSSALSAARAEADASNQRYDALAAEHQKANAERITLRGQVARLEAELAAALIPPVVEVPPCAACAEHQTRFNQLETEHLVLVEQSARDAAAAKQALVAATQQYNDLMGAFERANGEHVAACAHIARLEAELAAKPKPAPVPKPVEVKVEPPARGRIVVKLCSGSGARVLKTVEMDARARRPVIKERLAPGLCVFQADREVQPGVWLYRRVGVEKV